MGKLKESLLRLLVITVCFVLVFAVFASYQYTISLENRPVISTTIPIKVTDNGHSISSEITIWGVVPERTENKP